MLSAHLPWFAAAAATTLIGVWATLRLLAVSSDSTATARWGVSLCRIAAATATLSTTAWAAFMLLMHLAYPLLQVDLDGSDVLPAWATVLGGTGAALAIVKVGARSARNAALAGSLLCAGASCMVFVTMSGLAAPSVLAYNLGSVLVAMAGGSALCSGGVWLLWRRPGVPFVAGALVTVALLVLCGASLASILPFSDWDVAGANPGGLVFRPVTVVFLSELALTLALGAAGAGVDRQAAAGVARENERLRQLSESTFEALLLHRDGVVLDANTAFCELVGRRLEDLRGQPVARVLPHLAPESDHAPAAARALAQQSEIVSSGGVTLPVEILSREIPYAGGMARVTALRDISERRAAEAQIRFMAEHDSLTGLPNRARFREIIARQLSLQSRDGTPIAVFGIDLDRFKNVNDTLGHQAGDLLLVQVAQRITGAIRECDTIARIGGDEFILLQTMAVQPDAAGQLAARLVKLLAEPFDLDGNQASIGASIGIAVSPRDGGSADELIKNADIALYRAKAAGRGTFCFFEAGMDTHLRERRDLEQDLAAAVAEGGLDLAYQPLFECGAQGALVGFDVLARWTHPARGAVAPDQFIPLAEETGLIVPLGAWVLDAACREAAAWPGAWRIAVNVSPRELASADFVASVAATLARTGLAAERLEMEITETAFMRDPEAAMRTLRRLKEHGVRIALDDFGAGHSSLSYLRRFPFDRLKIDRSFVQSLGASDDTRAIMGAILSMCRQLRLEVTAEGVESIEQLDQLRAQRCDHVQGYLLARPMPQANLRPYLAGHAEQLPAAALATGAPVLS